MLGLSIDPAKTMVIKMAKKYTILTQRALEIVEEELGHAISKPTILKWASLYGLGKKVGGRYFFHEEKLRYYLQYGIEE